MQAYLDILKRVLEQGTPKQPVRRGPNGEIVPVENGTIALPNQFLSHEMSDRFPLLTCRRMPIRSAAVELQGFLAGKTSKKWYEDRQCKYWREWCNPKKIPHYVDDNGNLVSRLRSDNLEQDLIDQRLLSGMYRKATREEQKAYMLTEDDLGAAYPWSWRKFGQSYDYGQFHTSDNGVTKGVDQIQNLIDGLLQEPYSRRLVVTAWNPLQLDLCSLPSCHYSFVVNVIGDKINLAYTMRSCDFLLGHNIHTYGLLLLLLAKLSGFTPGNLSALFVDCHIYNNQIDAAKELVTRQPKELPTLEILQDYPGKFDLFKWDYKDIKLNNYNPHPNIKMEVTV